MAENCTFPERDAVDPPSPPGAADPIGDWTPSSDAATGKWGKVTESASIDGLTVYGFTEQDPVATPGVYTLKLGGIVGRPWSNPAKEENSNPSVPVNTYIHIFPGLRVEPSGHANVTQHGNSSLSRHTIQEAFIRDGGGGTFALVYNDGSALYTTGPLSLGANATAVKNALEALSNVTSVNVSGNGHIGDPYNITFLDSFADIANLTFDLAETEWSQEWYFKHQPTSSGGGNGTVASVWLWHDYGNGTFIGSTLVPDHLNKPTTGIDVLVYTTPYTPDTDGWQSWAPSYFTVRQVLECFFTGDTVDGYPVVYPQHTAPMANLTLPGIVNTVDQELGDGNKTMAGVNVGSLISGDGNNFRLRCLPNLGGSSFVIDNRFDYNTTIGGSPANATDGSAFRVGGYGVNHGIELDLRYTELPLRPPRLHIQIYDCSGAVGGGGPGVQTAYEFWGKSTTASPAILDTPDPLPGVILFMGWVVDGQLSVGNCTYFNSTPAIYTNMTLAAIIADLDARLAALEP